MKGLYVEMGGSLSGAFVDMRGHFVVLKGPSFCLRNTCVGLKGPCAGPKRAKGLCFLPLPPCVLFKVPGRKTLDVEHGMVATKISVDLGIFSQIACAHYYLLHALGSGSSPGTK